MFPASFRLALIAAGLLVAPGQAVSAQAACNSGPTCSVTVTLRLGRPQVSSLALSEAVTMVPALTAADFSLGRKDLPGPRLTVKANAPYRITIQSAQSTWQYAGTSANPGKTAADLLWSGTATGPFTSSVGSTTLWPATAASAPATAGQVIPIFYRTQWQWTNSPPGSYSLPINLTLTSP